MQQAINTETISANVIASLSKLNKSFSTTQALTDVSLDISAHQVTAILGENGAGKTTLINMMLGRLGIDSGEISIFSSVPGDISVKRRVGAMLQVANLPDTLKIKEHIALFQSYYPDPMPYDDVIAYAGLQNLQERYSKNLSGGEKRRLLFALSICGNPQLLFLDEPSTGMDVEARQGIWAAVRKLKSEGCSIILTTHYLPEAEALADDIILLKEGEVIKRGSSEEIKSSVKSTMVRFSTSQPLAVFLQLAGAESVSSSGKFVSVQSKNPNQTIQDLLQKYPDIEDLSVSNVGLEDAFLKLNDNNAQITGALS